MSHTGQHAVLFPMLALGTLLVLALLAGCPGSFFVDEASQPEIGDPCDGTQNHRCSGTTDFKSFCFNGRWTSVECRGPRGCSSFSIALCDQRIGVVGMACDPDDGWTREACSLRGDAELRCARTGVFVKVRDCPSGCVLNPGDPPPDREVDCQ